MWFRIELNKDRSVKSCDEVESSVKDGRSVYYIEAPTKELAIKALAARWDRKQERARARYLAKVDLRWTTGKCVNCDNAARSKALVCDACYAKHSERRRQRLAGVKLTRLPAATTPEEKAASVIKARESSRATQRERNRRYWRRHRRDMKLVTLQRALEAFDSMSSTAFKSWLLEEIHAASIKPSLKAFLRRAA